MDTHLIPIRIFSLLYCSLFHCFSPIRQWVDRDLPVEIAGILWTIKKNKKYIYNIKIFYISFYSIFFAWQHHLRHPLSNMSKPSLPHLCIFMSKLLHLHGPSDRHQSDDTHNIQHNHPLHQHSQPIPPRTWYQMAFWGLSVQMMSLISSPFSLITGSNVDCCDLRTHCCCLCLHRRWPQARTNLMCVFLSSQDTRIKSFFDAAAICDQRLVIVPTVAGWTGDFLMQDHRRAQRSQCIHQPFLHKSALTPCIFNQYDFMFTVTGLALTH